MHYTSISNMVTYDKPDQEKFFYEHCQTETKPGVCEPHLRKQGNCVGRKFDLAASDVMRSAI